MKKIEALRLSALSLAVLSLAAHSQTRNVPAVAAGAEMIVSAQRTEQRLVDVLADVSVIDRATIERSGVTGLADVLARVPGVEMARNGGPGTVTGVFVRGAENRFTAVYLDGVRLDSQATGGVSWESIPLALIDRIEVLRGPAAAVYGSDALGGVVNLFTRKGEEGKPAMSVGLGVGSYGTRRLDAGISGKTGAVDYGVGLADERSNGFNSRPTTGQNPDKDGYKRQSANAKLGLQINPVHRLDATVLASALDSQYDSSTAFVDERNMHKLQTLGLAWRAQWTKDYSTRLSVTDSISRYESKPSPYLTQTHLNGVLLQNEWRTGGQLFTGTLEHRGDRLDNPSTAFSPALNKGRAQNGAALGWGYQGGGHSVQVNARRDQDSEFGGKGTGSLAYAYALSPALRATAALATGFRAPTLYQRFSEYGVASLKPESSRNIEIGLKSATTGPDQFSAVVYQNRVTNLISFAGAGTCASSFGCYANTARAMYEGITLAGKTRYAGVDLSASVDLQNPRDLDTGKRLARRAKQHALLAANTTLANWRVGAELQLTGQRFSSPGESLSLPGYGLVNLSASTRVAADWTVLLRGDNLTGRNYQSVSGYATPGRSVFAALKWSPQ